MELTLEITSKCQLKCSYCSSWSKQDGKHVPTEKIKNIIDKENFDSIRFSGGEPTLHPDLDEIIRYVKNKDRNIKVIILTNGLNKLHPLILEYIDEIYVHWHYIMKQRGSLLKYINVNENILYFSKFVDVYIHVVNEIDSDIMGALTFGFQNNIPVRILHLQKQGRGMHSEPNHLLQFTGQHGCTKAEKITITHDGKRTSCTAFKGKNHCDLLDGEKK